MARTGSNSETKDTAGVIAPPPLIHLSFILVGLLLHYFWPFQFVAGQITSWIGGTLVVLSILLAVMGGHELQKAKTPINPHKPTDAIVRTGPYRFSRNPLYVALSFLHLGVGIWLSNIWVIAMLLPAFIVMSRGVIAREERYLERKFGQVYLEYKSSVRRWL